MKNELFLFFASIALLTSCGQSAGKNGYAVHNQAKDSIDFTRYIGGWYMKSGGGHSNTFSIKIFVGQNKNMEGQYCSVVRQGSRMDCPSENERNITDFVKTDSGYMVSFQSSYGAKGGKAQLYILNTQLYWKIIEKPVGEYYCPSSAVLYKEGISDAIGVGNLSDSININSVNYSGSDITEQLYKNIIEEYGCGENEVNGMKLPGKFGVQLFIVENDCGDFPFKDLISVKNGKTYSKIMLESSFIKMDEFKDAAEDSTVQKFVIASTSNIHITDTHYSKGRITKQVQRSYQLTREGKFVPKIASVERN